MLQVGWGLFPENLRCLLSVQADKLRQALGRMLGWCWEAKRKRATPVGREKTFELALGQGPVGLGERQGWLRRALGPEHNCLFSRHSWEC